MFLEIIQESQLQNFNGVLYFSQFVKYKGSNWIIKKNFTIAQDSKNQRITFFLKQWLFQSTRYLRTVSLSFYACLVIHNHIIKFWHHIFVVIILSGPRNNDHDTLPHRAWNWLNWWEPAKKWKGTFHIGFEQAIKTVHKDKNKVAKNSQVESLSNYTCRSFFRILIVYKNVRSIRKLGTLLRKKKTE